MTDAIVHRGPDEDGALDRARGRARHAPPEHHRPRRAAISRSRPRTRRCAPSSTARSTTSPSCATALLRPRTPLAPPTATRRRSCTSTRSTGLDFVAAPARHVRDRPVGRAAPTAGAGPRPHGRQAALLRRDRRRARLRLRGQGADRWRPRAAPSSTRSRPSSSSRTASCRGRARCSPACASSPRRRCWSGRTARCVERARRTGRRGSAGADPGSGPLGGGPGAACSSCCAARSARRMVTDVPLGVMLVGRPRLEPDHSADGRAVRPARADVLDRLRGGRRGRTSSPTRARVAQRLGTDHHELLTSAADHPELLDEALWHLEEPIADVSFLGFLLLSRLARERVTVALSGQGADELLGGYRKHQIAALPGHAAARRRGRCAAAVARWRRAPAPELDAPRAACSPSAADDPVERLLAMSRVLQSGRARAAAEPGVPPSPAPRRRSATSSPAPAVRAARAARRDAAHRHAPGARRQHAPVLRQDVDGGVARGPGAVHGPRRRLVLRAPAGLAAASAARVERSCSGASSRGLVDDSIIDKPKRGFFHSALGAWLSATPRRHRPRDAARRARAVARGQYRPEALQELVAASGRGWQEGRRRCCSASLLLERWERLFVDGDATMLRRARDGARRRRARVVA